MVPLAKSEPSKTTGNPTSTDPPLITALSSPSGPSNRLRPTPDSERPDWILTVSTQKDRIRHRLGTSWGLSKGDTRHGESRWHRDWTSAEISTLVGLRNSLRTLRKLSAQKAQNRRQSLGLILDRAGSKQQLSAGPTFQRSASRFNKSFSTGLWKVTRSFGRPRNGNPALSRNGRMAPRDFNHRGKYSRAEGDPPDRSCIRQRISHYLNGEAEKDIRQRLTSHHLTGYLTNFRRGHFPGKYLERLQTSRLSQFAANHFPSNQYLFRFGALAESPACACGAALEDRDHLLMECPLLQAGRRKLQRQIAETLSIACILQHPKELSEFVECIGD